MAVLVLDTEALSALPAAVLVELYRARGFDEPVDAMLACGFVQIVTTGARIARIAGHLLATVRSGSEMAIDALVVGTAIRLGGGMVITHGPGDLRLLAAGHSKVTVATI